MSLPALVNRTKATAGIYPCVTAEGWLVLVVVKQLYCFDFRGRVEEVPTAVIRHGDEPWGETGASSTRYPHDLAPTKLSSDVLVVGDAMTPGGALQRELPVRVEVGDAALSAQVLGPRTWADMGHAIVPTTPLPFTRAPMRWEHAFGGLDASDPARVLEEARNPVGCGLVGEPRGLLGTLAPHVEDPSDPIRDHRSRPTPVGFGPLGPSFEPRRGASGTHDDVWVRNRMPMPPMDQSVDFHQVAPVPLRTQGFLQGGEPVRALGWHAIGALAFDLPQRWFVVEAPDATGTTELVAALDTVILEPNDLRLELVWRASFPWPHRPSQRRNRVRLSSLEGR